MTEIRFFVAGIPQSGGSKSAFVLKKAGAFTGRAVITEAGTAASRQRKKDWRYAVSQKASESIKSGDGFPLTSPVELELIFQMPRPKGHYRSNGLSLRPSAPMHHITMPDAGKLARGTTDSLKGILWRDDSQIVKETHEKAYSDQVGCWIVVRAIKSISDLPPIESFRGILKNPSPNKWS